MSNLQQEVKHSNNNTFLIILCTLTIIGSLLTMGRALFYEIFARVVNGSLQYRGWIYFFSSIGTMTGAVIMSVHKSKNGLYVYSISQIIYIITVVIATFSHDEFGKQTYQLAITIALFFLVPSIIFLILYWLPFTNRNLQ